MAAKSKRSKRVKRSAERRNPVAVGEETSRLGKSRCVACNAQFEPAIEIVLVHDPIVPLELSPRRGLPRHCPECRKIARLRLQFPLLGRRNESDQKVGPILPLSKIASLREFWESIESPLAGCTEFLSGHEERKVRTEVGQRLFQIFHLADNGDEKALRLLTDIAKGVVQGLEDIARRQPQLLRPFARKSSLWPSFIGRKRKALAISHKARLRELQIGADNPYRGNWQYESPATVTAIYMHRWLNINQRALRLPAPNQAGAASKWFDIGWRALLVRTDGHPEKDNFLKQLGQRGLERIAARYKEGKLPRQSEAVNRRAEIRRRVKQAYLGFVRNVLAA
jgi:hypothetical protein